MWEHRGQIQQVGESLGIDVHRFMHRIQENRMLIEVCIR